MPIQEYIFDGIDTYHSIGLPDIVIDPIPPFTMDVTKPGPLHTGLVTDSTTLISVSGNQTYATNDTIIENRRFLGKVSVTGKRIRFYNCWFNSSVNDHLLACTNANVEDLEIERCLFRPNGEGNNMNGPWGHDYTAIQCDISGVIDGFGIHKTGGGAMNVEIAGCYIHDFLYLSPDASHSDNASHNDGNQIRGGFSIYIHGTFWNGFYDQSIGDASQPSVDHLSGSTLVHDSGNKYYPWMTTTSCIIWADLQYASGGFIIDHNWLDGGAVCINISPAVTSLSGGTGTGVITNNKWGRGMRLGQDFTILAASSLPLTISGNTYEDTGVAYNGRKAG